jgi:hypothetical protein
MNIQEQNTKIVEEFHSHKVYATESWVDVPSNDKHKLDIVFDPLNPKSPILRMFDAVTNKPMGYFCASFFVDHEEKKIFMYPVWQHTIKEFRNRGVQKILFEELFRIYASGKIKIASVSNIQDYNLELCSCYDTDNSWWTSLLRSKNAILSPLKKIDGYNFKFTATPTDKLLKQIREVQATYKKDNKKGIYASYKKFYEF